MIVHMCVTFYLLILPMRDTHVASNSQNNGIAIAFHLYMSPYGLMKEFLWVTYSGEDFIG